MLYDVQPANLLSSTLPLATPYYYTQHSPWLTWCQSWHRRCRTWRPCCCVAAAGVVSRRPPMSSSRTVDTCVSHGRGQPGSSAASELCEWTSPGVLGGNEQTILQYTTFKQHMLFYRVELVAKWLRHWTWDEGVWALIPPVLVQWSYCM